MFVDSKYGLEGARHGGAAASGTRPNARVTWLALCAAIRDTCRRIHIFSMGVRVCAESVLLMSMHPRHALSAREGAFSAAKRRASATRSPEDGFKRHGKY